MTNTQIVYPVIVDLDLRFIREIYTFIYGRVSFSKYQVRIKQFLKIYIWKYFRVLNNVEQTIKSSAFPESLFIPMEMKQNICI